MRHLTAIIAALMLLSLPAGWALAENKGKKMELTDHEMDAVTAAGPGADASNLATILSVQLFSRLQTSQIGTLIFPNSLQIDFSDGSQTTSITYGKTNLTTISFKPLTVTVNGIPVFSK